MTDLIDISQLRPVEMGSHRKDTNLIFNSASGVGVYLEQFTMQNTCNFIIAVDQCLFGIVAGCKAHQVIAADGQYKILKISILLVGGLNPLLRC